MSIKVQHMDVSLNAFVDNNLYLRTNIFNYIIIHTIF